MANVTKQMKLILTYLLIICHVQFHNQQFYLKENNNIKGEMIKSLAVK